MSSFDETLDPPVPGPWAGGDPPDHQGRPTAGWPDTDQAAHPIRLAVEPTRRSGPGWMAVVSLAAAAVLVGATALVGLRLASRPAAASGGGSHAMGAASDVAPGGVAAPRIQVDSLRSETPSTQATGSGAAGAGVAATDAPTAGPQATTVPTPAPTPAVAPADTRARPATTTTRSPASTTVYRTGPGGQGVARVVVSCGTTRATRRIESFTVKTDQPGTYFLGATNPGGGLIQALAVGDQYPVGKEIVWSIRGILLGPWPVNELVDRCSGVTTVEVTTPPHQPASTAPPTTAPPGPAPDGTVDPSVSDSSSPSLPPTTPP